MCFRFLLFSMILLSTLSPGFCQENEEYLFPAPGDYPVLKKTGKKADDFVPRGWTVLAKAEGDLNGDRIEDCALVVKGESEKFKVRNFEKLGADTNEIHRGDGEQVDVSYNFLSGKASVKKGNISDDVDAGAQWKKIKPPYRKTLESLKKLYQWEAIPGYKL